MASKANAAKQLSLWRLRRRSHHHWTFSSVNNIKKEKRGKKMRSDTKIPIEVKNMPEKKFRAGGITATVWRNEFKHENGEVKEYRTVSFDKSYKDKTGNWKNTNSLRMDDLPKAALVLEEAFKYLALVEKEPQVEEIVY